MNRIKAHYEFTYNRDTGSELVDVHQNVIEPIANDWQSPDIIPTLQNKLDILIKKPGIYPASEIVKLDPSLYQFFNKLPAYSQINEDGIPPYRPPGEDKNLLRLAKKHKSKYMMSTSTVSSVLSHIYYSLSNHKSPHFDNLSEAYDREPLKFMISQRKPSTIFLREVDDNLFAVDSDSGFMEEGNIVLLKMGKYMEKMLTTDWRYFNDHFVLDLKTNKPVKPLDPSLVDEDYFRYMRSGKMFLRSQIDTKGVDSEGNDIVFELKTRATAVLRYDITNYIDYLDYEVGKYKGQHSSYEREFYDLVRGGFLKYIMQMKIGQMQGAAIAYHNTQKIFGFEYIKLKEMEKRVFGCPEFSDVIFRSSLTILEKIMDYLLHDQLPKHREKNKIFKVGFYASELSRSLVVMLEIFENDEMYQERFRNTLPEYMRDPIDYYVAHGMKPEVIRYSVKIQPIHNGIPVDKSPIMFEDGDNLDVRLAINKVGHVDFNQYMKFLHEAYKVQNVNINNEFVGTWSFNL